MVILFSWLSLCIPMASRQQSIYKIKSSKLYLINTRKTKRDVDLKPIYKMIENSTESPTISPMNNLVSLGNQPIKKHFLLTKIALLQNFNFNLPHFWSHDANFCEAKFTISGIEAPVLKFMTILETLTTGQLEKLYDIPKPQDPDCFRNCALSKGRVCERQLLKTRPLT